jgi:NAD(P)-dependent dehydrogenase (short-subunit alcohol dehydrogenase family)
VTAVNPPADLPVQHGDFGVPGMENRVALVTGSSRGTGKAIALALADAGAAVAVNYREQSGGGICKRGRNVMMQTRHLTSPPP